MNHYAPFDLNSIDANPQEVLEVLKKHLSTKPELLTILNSINLEQEDGHSQFASFCEQYAGDIASLISSADLQEQSSHQNPEELATLQQDIDTPGTLAYLTKTIISKIKKINEDKDRNISKDGIEYHTHSTMAYTLNGKDREDIQNKIMQFVQGIMPMSTTEIKKFVVTFLQKNLKTMILLIHPEMQNEGGAERMQLMETCTNTFFDLITDKDSLDFYRRGCTTETKELRPLTMKEIFSLIKKGGEHDRSWPSELTLASSHFPFADD